RVLPQERHSNNSIQGDYQKQHHAENRLIPVLERTDDGGVQMIRELGTLYATNHDTWWAEMLDLDDSL
ncbi:MAG TPA: hypothetical protein P5121_24305, partial [Caldilineaceae bacterium]|nr:hypothetical protein [Caldilineaceae bacterium]